MSRREARVGDATLITLGPNNTRVALPGGAGFVVVADPHDPEQVAAAEATGYGRDVARLCRERTIMHAVLAELRGQPLSPSWVEEAWGLGVVTPEEQAKESGEVLALLAWLNSVNGEFAHIRHLSQTHDLRRLHRRANEVITLLTPPPEAA